MHEELIKRLRNAAQWADKGLVITPSVCLEAADAIEELQKRAPKAPHGRLGDLDKLENDLRHMAKYQYGERQQGILGCCETIRLAPTVIEAERGK